MVSVLGNRRRGAAAAIVAGVMMSTIGVAIGVGGVARATPPPDVGSTSSGPAEDVLVDSDVFTDSVSGQEAIDLVNAGAPVELDTGTVSDPVNRAAVVELLANDPTLHLVGDALVYLDPMPEPSDDHSGVDRSGDGETSAVDQVEFDVSDEDIENAFKLHSRPGSDKKIYLDFDGHVTDTWPDDGIIESAPFDLDGDDQTFNRQERERIVRAWDALTAAVDTWDVDVTTEEPPLDYLTRTSSNDTTFGQRVVITPSRFRDRPGLAGIARLWSFRSSVDTPTYVFSGPYGFEGHTVAHEVGHTFGLRHDGQVGGDEYYHGNGVWFPIMGCCRHDELMYQWSRGEYIRSSNREDDLQIIGQMVTPLADVHSSVPTRVTSGIPQSGLINAAIDTDEFRIDTAGGEVKIRVGPRRHGNLLDLGVTVRDAAGAEVAARNRQGLSAEELKFDAAPGRYIISVDGVGYANPADFGYSDYSSIGQYDVVATFAEADVPSADFIDQTHSIDFDGDGRTDVFTAEWTGQTYQWKFSSGGRSGWRNLETSNDPLDELRFGDFDGDGKTDVFKVRWTGSSYEWYTSSGGVGRWALLSAHHDEPLEDLRFGDFDGDGTTDVFTATWQDDRYYWKLSSGGTASWKWLGWSRMPLDELRFGDFDGDGQTDLFAADLTGTTYSWRYFSLRTQKWKQLRSFPASMDQLRFGDFDGDAKTDVLVASGEGDSRGLYFSSGGIWGWTFMTLMTEPFDDLRFGDFDGDGMFDVFVATSAADRFRWRYLAGGRYSWVQLQLSDIGLDRLRLS